jgi:hypothetical protein
MRRAVHILSVGLAVLTWAAAAGAQPIDERVRELNREAMNSYHDLEIERAEELLQFAREIGESEGASPQPLALTYLNLGIIAIGVHSDNGLGLELFERALRAHPSIRLDPMTATPQIEGVFALALRSATPSEPEGEAARVVPLLHQTPVEALRHTPLALFVEAPASVDVVRVAVRFRRRGEGELEERALSRIRRANGYGIELPCEIIDGEAVEYFIEAMGPKGLTVARAGSASEPLVVPVVDVLSVPVPALPRRKAPVTCKAPPCDADESCVCRDSSDCRRDERCVAGQCEPAPSKGLLRRGGRFFGAVGIAIGSARVTQGAIAASTPPGHPALVGPAEAGPIADYQAAGIYGGYVENAATGSVNPAPYCDAPEGEFCVALAGAAMVPVFGAVFSGGFWLLDDLAITGSFRLAFRSDGGPMQRALITAGAQYRVLHAREGFIPEVAVGGGLGVGQIQIPTNQQEGQVEPMARTGLGEVHVLVPVRFFVIDDLAVEILPTFRVMFPHTTIVPEVTIGGHFVF